MISAFDFTSRARPVVELGIGDVRNAIGGVWDAARWDTDDAWSGIEPEWIDVSCDTRSARVEYGRRAVTDRFVPGAATVVVDNASGWADPNTADPPGSLSIRPGRPIRVGVVHEVYGYRVLFRGFVDSMTPVYSPNESDAVELSCIDALGEVNRAKLVALEVPVGAGETASDRVERILNAIPWIPRDVWPSAETLVATDLGGQVADMLGVTADSAGGAVFGDLEGRVAFRPRDWQTYAPDAPVDGTIGNVDQGGTVANRVTFGELNYLEDGEQVIFGETVIAGDVCPTSWERPFVRADIATRAIMGRSGSPPVVVDDDDAIAKYGVEPFERVDLLTESDATLLLLAERALRTRGELTAPRVRSVSLDARTSTGALDLMSTVDVYAPSRYRCRLAYPPPRGLVFDGQYFATGVAHELTRSSWTLELNLDVAAPFATFGDRWDTGGWDYADWTDAVELLAEARSLMEALA